MHDVVCSVAEPIRRKRKLWKRKKKRAGSGENEEASQKRKKRDSVCLEEGRKKVR